MPFPSTHPALEAALAERGYQEPTPVQAAVLADDARGRDLLVSAQTGSGKTVAFGLAAAATLLGEEERFGPAGLPVALVVAPTRELALQVHKELGWLYGQTGARVVSCVGGMEIRREQRALKDGSHIVVGTPGRLRDHIERGFLDVSGLRVVVLDEADEMLDLGFRDDLEAILDATPEARRTLLFSATIARNIVALTKRYQQDALRIDTLVQNQPHGDIDYQAIRVAPGQVEHAVVNVLRFHEAPASLVFCSTREAVRRLHAGLLERGFNAVALSGELSQAERSHALHNVRVGRARICVATDVAARGLDLPALDLVVHADLPNDKATLLHRSGRTGRAGRKGTSVLLVPYNRRRRAEQMLAAAGVDVLWSGAPSADSIRLRDQARMVADPVLTEAPGDEDLAAGRALLKDRSPEAIAAALVRIWRSAMPAPEDLFEELPAETVKPARGARLEADGPQAGDRVWFRMAIGRRNNADPKWLVPLICRQGHVTKKEIGAIRIFADETKFEIAAASADAFAQAVQQAGEDDVRIERAATAPGIAARRAPHRGRPSPDRWQGRKGKPNAGFAHKGKPSFKAKRAPA
ncbi:DEAD/DEAH box helicase [Marinivivus vitaminiproducens]|uniref:DEAD/DEAH box helicase n=1 Tax=Marinivivus vitaminiproducens TaxID=3035935 RepID=UPI0027A4D3F4|nr:DEAD/DEAH box helicase [Geminicoccaceae bacterium SCSIO 64248]